MWYLYPKQTLENTERQAKMNNPEKLAVFGTKNEKEKKTQHNIKYDVMLFLMLSVKKIIPFETTCTWIPDWFLQVLLSVFCPL